MSQNRSTAVMQRRTEPHDSLDDFPTPPWATRALIERVILPSMGDLAGISAMSVWEPACNRGYMARPLKEYFRSVHCSDVHDYSAEWDGQERVCDFLFPGSEPPHIAAHGVDWIITNPPFRLAEQFIRRALGIKGVQGVAILQRTAFLEGQERFSTLFRDTPPAIVAQFVERVAMFRGRVDPEGASATAYCWLVWMAGVSQTELVWIPPSRRLLERSDDYPAVVQSSEPLPLFGGAA